MENNQTTMDIYYNLLEESVSNIVHVFCNQEGIRNSFCTGFSICGKLEKHKDLDSYRVVLALGTYVYFTSKDIVWVIKHFEYFQRKCDVVFFGKHVLFDYWQSDLHNERVFVYAETGGDSNYCRSHVPVRKYLGQLYQCQLVGDVSRD